MIDLGPAAQRLATLAAGAPDDALGRPTPCRDYTVGDLLDHLAGVPMAFAAAARKQPVPPAPAASAANLAPGWRDRLVADLDDLVAAWRDPAAWEGMTQVGGVDLPGEVCALVGLDELLVHGWDLAVATGQPAGYDGPGLDALHEIVVQFQGAGIFDAEVAVPAGATPFDRILGLTGRDPAWSPST